MCCTCCGCSCWAWAVLRPGVLRWRWRFENSSVRLHCVSELRRKPTKPCKLFMRIYSTCLGLCKMFWVKIWSYMFILWILLHGDRTNIILQQKNITLEKNVWNKSNILHKNLLFGQKTPPKTWEKKAESPAAMWQISLHFHIKLHKLDLRILSCLVYYCLLLPIVCFFPNTNRLLKAFLCRCLRLLHCTAPSTG